MMSLVPALEKERYISVLHCILLCGEAVFGQAENSKIRGEIE